MNSSILVGGVCVFGLSSIFTQICLWNNGNGTVMSSIKDIMSKSYEHLMTWNMRDSPNYNTVAFMRLSITAVVSVALLAIILSSYDSVDSFWLFATIWAVILITIAIPLLTLIIRRLVAYYYDRKLNM